MAGLGFKDFQVGEVLTSSDVDGYLMAQAVMRFADSAARGSALGTATGTAVPLAEGMVSYLDDTNTVEVYNGTAWLGVGNRVASTVKDDTFTTTSQTFVDITGLTLTITPTSTASKILLIANVAVGSQSTTINPILLLTDGSDNPVDTVASGTHYDSFRYGQDASAIDRQSIVVLVSPASTSAQTYKVRMRAGTVGSAYINRNGANDAFAYSTITAIEVA